MKQNFAEYPFIYLSNLSYNEKIYLIANAIRVQDYKGLNHLLNNIHCNSEIILKLAIDRLDVEAVRVISTHQNFISNLCSTSTNIVENIIHYLIPQPDLIIAMDPMYYNGYLSSYKEEKCRITEILKILLKTIGDNSPAQLTNLAQFLPESEFYEFYKDKKVDLSEPKYLGINNLPHYKFAKEMPLLSLDQANNPNVVDIILSRTYSKELRQPEARKIYEDILKPDPMAKEMLSYLALEIAQGNTIAIYFVKDERNMYYNFSNYVVVNTNLSELKTIESFVIHEIGHFFYDTLFENYALPISREDTFKVSSKLKNADDGFSTLATLTQLPEFQAWRSFLDEYERAARQPIYKAAELLKFNTTPMDKYKTSQEYTEYFRQKSIITIFSLKGISIFLDNDYDKIIEWAEGVGGDNSFINVLLDICLTYSSKKECEGKNTNIKSIKWALEIYFPKVVEELKLTPQQIYFLERIGDYLNYINNRSPELIVRYAELKIADVGQELLDSFNGLVEFHNKYASPRVEKAIDDYCRKCANLEYNNLQPMCYLHDHNSTVLHHSNEITKTVCISDLCEGYNY